MDALQLETLRLEFLGDQATRADTRIAALAQEIFLHRGGLQHLGALNGLIEGHRDRLRAELEPQAAAAGPPPDPAAKDAETQPAAQPAPPNNAATLRHTISGVHDALTYLRAQVRAAELSAKQAEASLAEMQRHRDDLGSQGRNIGARIDHLRKQLANGTPPEQLGRPAPASAVRAEVDRRRRQAKGAAGPAQAQA